jgi:hypothetical protein
MKKLIIIAGILLVAAGCNTTTVKQEPTEQVVNTPTGDVVAESVTPEEVSPVETIPQTPVVLGITKKAETITQNTPQPTPTEVFETPEQQNQRLLNELQKKAVIENQARAVAEQVRAEEQAKQDLITAKKTECTDPMNKLRQEVIDINTKYNSDVEAAYEMKSTNDFIQGTINTLSVNRNLLLSKANNQISQLSLQCEIKYGTNN